MDYNIMLEDYVRYMNRHWMEEWNIDEIGRIHSLKGEYISYLFECFYEERMDLFIKKLKQNQGLFLYPQKRICNKEVIRQEQMWLGSMDFCAMPLIDNEQEQCTPIEKAAETYVNREEMITMWWHDEEFNAHYMKGYKHRAVEPVTDDGYVIRIPASKYQVFSMRIEKDISETLKTLIVYVHREWIPENEGKVDLQGYHFEGRKNDNIYYFLALLEEEKENPSDKVYGVDTWTRYIDDHVFGNITTSSLAKRFGYSPTHFKRVFHLYYQMSVSDYIRKRRLAMIADAIRDGMDHIKAAKLYGYFTYTGFAKAFKKEFNISPAVYSKGTFEVIDLCDYYENNKDILRVSIVDINTMKMVGHTVFPSKGSEVDIPAQIYYWLGRDFPCLKNTRYSCNVEHREDKIALWYQEEETGDIEYILGPVVNSLEEDLPEEMIRVTLEGGKYAIFETDKMSDEDDVAETLRMYARCVFFGWVKEYRDRVDLSRITFERYVNQKIYLYVPVKY